MILYDSNYFGLPQLLTFNGSAVYRTLLPSLFSTMMILVYKYTFGEGETAQEIKEEDDEPWLIAHPFVITIYVMAYSLIINHRLNYCYQRYWESCSSIFMMTSKWIDSATTLASFHYQSIVYDEDRPRSFGDEDKPMDQRKDTDRNKAAPTGGNTRTDDNMVYHSDDEGSVSSSVSSEDAALYSNAIDDMALAAAQVAASEAFSSERSQKSFVSFGSRQRYRKYSDSENLRRAKKQFSTDTGTNDTSDRLAATERNVKERQGILARMFKWKSIASIKYNEDNRASMDTIDQDQPGQQKQQTSSSFFGDVEDNTERNAAGTPTRANLSRKIPTIPKSPSMPSLSRNRLTDLVKKGTQDSSGTIATITSSRSDTHTVSRRRSITGHGINRSTSAGDGKGASVSHHRRLPSTDIPTPGAGGLVKSFKPNPSLAWQKRNTIAMPQNTGLHSTALNPGVEYDFERVLLEEKKRRKEKARKRQLEESRQQQQMGGSVRRRRGSLFRRTMKFDKSSSSDNLELRDRLDSTDRRISSEPRSPGETIPSSDEDDANDIDHSHRSDITHNRYRLMNANNFFNSEKAHLTDLFPRLELYDLPSLHRTTVGEGNPSKKPKLDVGSSDRSDSRGFRGSTATNSTGGRPSIRKMNGRASLFLQEAAHLYSLMSAVAMASLRADMEGVSSPLEDYVPGQKFPPVNPEEMQIKILVDEEDSEHDSDCEIDPNTVNGLEPDSHTRMDKNFSELTFGSRLHPNKKAQDRMNTTVRVTRNNRYFNMMMFLFGFSRDSRQRTIYNASRPFSVLGGISDAEVEMLRKVRGHAAQHALCCLWLREFITREHLNGSTGNIAPPIVARVYQHISDGTAQYNNCRKTAFTDFPFPHAQLTSFFGIVSIFIFPLLFFIYVNNTPVGMVLNLFTMSCFLGIQEVALELEQPFIRYPNDLPLNNYQAQFNEALISSLYAGFHPDAWGDAIDNGGIFGTNNNYNISNDNDNIDTSENENTSSSEDEGGDGKPKSANPFERTHDSRNSQNSIVNMFKPKKTRRTNQNTTVHFAIPEGAMEDL